jgi:16S rRNA (uracil1498-N3)-methyltransferase
MIRLFTEHSLALETPIPLEEKQAHYLLHVMRLREGETLLAFNGRDGEWEARLAIPKKNTAILTLHKQTRPQIREGDLWLIFAPIKRGHGDFAIEKASELGATKLFPVITDRTIVTRVTTDRMRAIAIEAAEQCERLSVPAIKEPQKLEALLAGWNPAYPILLCAEAGDAEPLADALPALAPGPVAVMVGPEGGFSEKEFNLLRAQSFITPVSLGPRVLRADTAAVSAISIIQALHGDWKERRN